MSDYTRSITTLAERSVGQLVSVEALMHRPDVVRVAERYCFPLIAVVRDVIGTYYHEPRP